MKRWEQYINFWNIQTMLRDQHQEILQRPESEEFKRLLGISQWWKEHGAFTVTTPRQTGKTRWLLKLYHQKFGSLCVRHHDHFDDSLFWHQWKGFAETAAERDVYIDEYNHIPEDYLIDLLSYNWKSVTMVGTVK